MEHLKPLIKENTDRFINELMDLLRIPSVSADSKYKPDVLRAAEFIRDKFKAAGADSCEVIPTAGHPVVYAEKIIDPSKPTILVYGHYDVQPPDPMDLWHSPPFEPVIKDEKIYARGACDDKGQVYMHIKAFELMMSTNSLPCNVKFMIEGEEEVGSENLGPFVIANKERLKSDVILISDTSIIANDVPSITTGLRGLAYLEVEVTGADHDLHSGTYGGGVANPINVLCKMIAALKDDNNHITIPGFYNDVEVISEEERKAMARAPFSMDAYKKHLGIDEVEGEAGYSTLERTTIRPTLDVNGIWGGYIGEGSKTVLPSKAFAKISMRLVPHQTVDNTVEQFIAYFKSLAPPSVKVEVRPHHGGAPVVTPTDSLAYRAASMAMEKTFGVTPIPARAGGSIPIVALFEKELGLKSLMMGFGLNTDLIHSPNEHYGIFNFLKGIETIPYFYEHFTAISAEK